MKITTALILTTCLIMVSGCVTKDTHEQTLADLEQMRKASAKTSADFNAFKQQSALQIAALEEEKAKLSSDLLSAQSAAAGLRDDKQMLIARATATSDEMARLQKRMSELETQGEALAAEKARLEKEHAAKEAEIHRLTKTQEDLTKSLKAEIERGDIKIKQVRDRLTINMVEKVLFNSGQARVKPAGLNVLKSVSDILKNVNDKQIRIEGHTDNVPIGVKIRDKFPTNWELSTGRATNVVRFFIEQGGVNRENLEAVGYADTRPVADNETEEGRTANRRIEITLFPKDLSAIVSEIKP